MRKVTALVNLHAIRAAIVCTRALCCNDTLVKKRYVHSAQVHQDILRLKMTNNYFFDEFSINALSRNKIHMLSRSSLLVFWPVIRLYSYFYETVTEIIGFFTKNGIVIHLLLQQSESLFHYNFFTLIPIRWLLTKFVSTWYYLYIHIHTKLHLKK